MRLFMFLVLLLVVAAGVGYWRGWITFSTTPKDDNKVSVSVEVDKDKIKSDAEAARKKVQGVGAAAHGQD